MNLELQKTLLDRYPKFFRKPGQRMVLAACPPGVPMDIIAPTGVHRFEVRAKSKHAEDYLEDDTSVFDHRGIECGDGWYRIIDRVACAFENAIGAMVRENVSAERWPRVRQIKEKFGVLRIYVGITGEMPEALAAAIKEAEHASARTCEACGLLGKLRKGGWVHVSCDTCEARHLERKARPFDTHTFVNHEQFAHDLRALLEARPE